MLRDVVGGAEEVSLYYEVLCYLRWIIHVFFLKSKIILVLVSFT